MVGAGTDQFNLVISRLEMLKVADSNLDSLPDDMLMQILIRIPAQDIHDSTMFVCRKWYDMIRTHSFIYTHLHHSTPGLLMLILKDMALSTLLSPTQGSNIQCKLSDISYTNYDRTYCWTSCNGLMLKLLNNDEKLQLTITNPLTKQHLPLPRFPVRVDQCQHPTNSSAIAYDATRTEYKVVRTCYLSIPTHKTSDHPMAPIQVTSHYFCAILTVGVDNSWRRVDTQHLSLTTSKQLRTRPLVTKGFVHWTDEYSRYVLTLNIQTEIITRIPVPRRGRSTYYLTAGESYLSLLNRHGRNRFKWEVWEMKPEAGEWTKMSDIDLEPHKALLNESDHKVNNLLFKPGDVGCLDCILIPAGWLKNREIIVFLALRKVDTKKGDFYSPDQLHVVYNIHTRDIYLFKSAASIQTPFVVHKSSLVRIPG